MGGVKVCGPTKPQSFAHTTGIVADVCFRQMMSRFLNLKARIFVANFALIGVALTIAKATGVICASPWQAAVGAVILSMVAAQIIHQVRVTSWRDVMKAVHESERTGKFKPTFPEDASMPEINRLSAALNNAARSIEHSQNDLDEAYLQFVETMAQALDARDPYTAGHSLRVAAYSYTLAQAMGLSDEEAETIRVAAQLHDIGKIGIPDMVLQKPGRLTADEYGLIKLHPQIGRKILGKVGRFEQLLPVVELHHENHDGSGYPYGLAGENIPLSARIVHVADVFDAMTTNRSYRTALPLQAAIAEIERNIGRQFDPFAANTFLGLIAEGKIEIGGLQVSAEVETLETVAV
jgi:putative nucleotidyltransferase with HDIG domain